MKNKKQLYEEKGQVGGAVGATIQLVTGVGVAVLVLIFIGVLSGQTYQFTESKIDDLTVDITQESLTVLNSTEIFLAHDEIVQGTVAVSNTTNTSSVVFGLDNFVIDYDTGGVTLTNNTLNNTATYWNYTHGPAEIQNSIKNSIVSGFEALEQTGEYMPLIVLAIIIFLILVLVLGFTTLGNFGGGQGKSSSVL